VASKLTNLMKRFVREEEGLELAEYALLAAVLLVAAATVYGTLGTNITNVITEAAAEITTSGSTE
jgi:pilus assembly protein Flp/PilA